MSKSQLAPAVAKERVAQMCAEFRDIAQSSAEEIENEAQERAESEFQASVSGTQEKLDTEFQRETNEINRNLQIREAQIKNNVKLEVLKSQTEAIHEALKEAVAELNKFSKGPEYPELLKKLMIEGLDRLKESRVRLMVRKSDLQIAETALKEAVKVVEEKNPGLVIKAKIEDERFLPAEPACAGGCVLVSQRGKIRVSNVLNDRLKLAYEGMLPQLRRLILGNDSKTVI